MMSIIYTFFNEHGLSEQQNDCAKRYYSEGLTKPNQILKAFEHSYVSTPLKSKITAYKPQFLIADGADSITNGFESGMGIDKSEYTRLYC